MDDLISRQAAIETAVSYIEEWNGAQSKFHRNRITERFLNLPSAQPEQKKGRWIPHIEESREYIGTAVVGIIYDYWFCDTCGYRVENGRPLYNFCPNCGNPKEKK